MTKEELKKEAEGYFKSICGDYNEEYERTGKRHYFVGFDIKNAYIASAEPREKRITELEAQIEKMKCCENCKHSNTTCECYTICTIGHYDDCKSNTVLDSLDKKDYWEN